MVDAVRVFDHFGDLGDEDVSSKLPTVVVRPAAKRMKELSYGCLDPSPHEIGFLDLFRKDIRCDGNLDVLGATNHQVRRSYPSGARADVVLNLLDEALRRIRLHRIAPWNEDQPDLTRIVLRLCLQAPGPRHLEGSFTSEPFVVLPGDRSVPIFDCLRTAHSHV